MFIHKLNYNKPSSLENSQDSVVLGGTHDKDQWDLTPRKEDAKFILDGCTQLVPSLEVTNDVKVKQKLIKEPSLFCLPSNIHVFVFNLWVSLNIV